MNSILRYILMVTMLMPFLLAPELGAFELQVRDGKLSVSADKVPLQDLLRALSFHDIVVRIDPKINPEVSVAFNSRELEDGLKSLLRPHNYAFIWKPASSSSNESSPYQLKEVHVFRPGEKDLMVVVEPPSAGAGAGADAGAGDQNRSEVETKVIIQNNKIYVPVKLFYQGSQIETTLVFDTGASGMVLHENVAQLLGIDQSTPSKARGVGGVEIDTRLAKLQRVVVGPHEKRGLPVSIVAYQSPSGQPDALYNGLLGMSFLKGIKYIIDSENQVIRWQQ